MQTRIIADQQQDREVRLEANRAFDILRRFIEQNAEEIAAAPRKFILPTQNGLNTVEHREPHFAWEEYNDALVLHGRGIGIPDADDLWIRIGPKQPGKVAMFLQGDVAGGTIELYDLRAPNDPTHLATRLNRESFVHEYVHYLDGYRQKTRTSLGDTEQLMKENIARYFNDPSELDAHYQHALSTIERIVLNEVENSDNLHQQAVRYFMGDSAQHFVEVMFRTLPKRMVANLTPDNRKRVAKRLAGWWQFTKDQMTRQTVHSFAQRLTAAGRQDFAANILATTPE